MIFWPWKVEIFATRDPREKMRVQEQFAKHGIRYDIKVEDYTQKNIANTFQLGTLGNNTIRPTYIFYVHKKDADAALWAIHSADA